MSLCCIHYCKLPIIYYRCNLSQQDPLYFYVNTVLESSSLKQLASVYWSMLTNILPGICDISQ